MSGLNLNQKNSSIRFVLEKFRKESKNTSELGSKFVRLIKKALLEDPSISGKFDKIWLWKDYPYKDDTDTGIDLVGLNKQNQYIAIQCKCFNTTTYLKDISTFMSKANTKFKVQNKTTTYSGMILFSTTDEISSHAKKSFSKQTLRTSIIHLFDLNKSKIDWSKVEENKLHIRPKKDINKRPYQEEAIDQCIKGFKNTDRGKLIMACGTGKTLTSLKLTEQYNKEGDFVLFLVPSIALMSQTIREWLQETDKDIQAFAVCSDKTTGKNNSEEDIGIFEIPYLATTDINSLKEQIKSTDLNNAINVIFSTYQSIDVIIQAQKKKILPKFNLTICDEAHRTTGFNVGKKEQSHFTKVHHKISSNKRLYMTATPRIYKTEDKAKVKVKGGEYYSMDDSKNYGEVFYNYGFSKAVEEGFLSDYKVIVLSVPKKTLSINENSKSLKDENELEVSDRAKIVGCYQGLQKKFIDKEEKIKQASNPMKRAVAFVRTINDSKKLSGQFANVIQEENLKGSLEFHSKHIDGTMSSGERDKKINWLKEEEKDTGCRILFNAKCLSEGVDVPALDSVIFLSSKNSEIDVVQSVGRVMRKAEGKEYGYIIIPVVIPSSVKPSEALEDHKKYKVIWQVIQALRSHDEKLKHEINRINLGEKSSKLHVIGAFEMEGKDTQLDLDFADWKEAIFGKVVLHCGERLYWDEWSKDVGKLAKEYFKNIQKIIKSDLKRKKYFDEFLNGLKKILNPSFNQEDAIKIISQHLISKPIFDSLFGGDSKTLKNSSVSNEVDKVIEKLNIKAKENVTSLQTVHKAIKDKVKGITTIEAKQKIIKELYSEFFKKAFKEDADRLGIVFSPIEAVDFMIQSVEHILNKEFCESLNDKDLKILEPFAGTGSFVARLIQSGIIKGENLHYKFENDIFSNEIMLLSHYISQANIEETFSHLTNTYKPFNGGVLTDTFQLEEQESSLKTNLFPLNAKKREEEKNKTFKVIISNPPYSVGQQSENDANKNTSYKTIDKRVKESYADNSSATLKRALSDSYVKAFRLASDKLGENGVLAFIHNSSLIQSQSMDGMRKVLEREFDKIYLFDLRGEAKGSAENQRKEGGTLFGQGSRVPICITFLIKNKKSQNEKAKIHYYDIGDYLTREEKLSSLNEFKSIKNINFKKITPNEEGDWIKQREDSFYEYLPLGDKKDKSKDTIFDLYSLGVSTSRDSWAYNFSKKEVSRNMRRMIEFYNNEIKRLKNKIDFKKFNYKTIDKHINRDSTKISWTREVKQDLLKEKEGIFKKQNIKLSSYRPFHKKYLYFDRMFNNCVYQNPKIWFTLKGERIENKAICVSGRGAKIFSVLMTDQVFDLHYIGDTQSFPQYFFDRDGKLQDGINDFTLDKFKNHYKDNTITKEDIFYYIYGLLHQKDYRERYKNNLSKSLPHITLCKDFAGFSKAGKELSNLHLKYETQSKLKEVKILTNNKEVSLSSLKPEDLKVKKMRLNKKDKSVIQFNNKIRITNIPPQAHNYKINDWSAIKWIEERYQVKQDKNTGIINDPNSFSDDPFYILNLLLSVITLSVKTQEIVNSLPVIDLGKQNKEVDLHLLLKRALVFTMMSDGKIKEVEKKSVSKCYKVITNYMFPHAEINSHLKAFGEGAWSKESLMKDFLDSKMSKELKEKILKGIIKVTMSDKDADRREIDFLENIAKIICFPEEKLQELIGRYEEVAKDVA